ncbi:YdcF family protein [uncultured Thiodictyon sp.]|uniref:YdcF family protein n=1 Tax=uncultured Thiodictyon sp. TaxID=1846217 RepID=UPI0025DBFDDE|nr:YdcF family protein [uncultured Thiodictyon sp.]
MLYIDKVIAQLAYPLSLSLALCLLALALLAVGRRRSGGLAVLAGVLWLGGWSLPVVSDALRLSLEGRFANNPVTALPLADVAVVLGGGIDVGPPQWPYPDLGAAVDRVWQGARIVRAGKAPWVIVTGGSMPWSGERGSVAEATRALLVDLGVPEQAVLLEGRSRNTREDALYSADAIRARGFQRVLLVTSALHMPRALECFRAVGIEAIAAPTDFEVMPEPPSLLRWLPDAEALAASTHALKEYLGLWMYRWRGWALPAAAG